MNRRIRRALLVLLTLACILIPTTALAAADDADDTITWMVRPSDGVGEDGRSWVELQLDPGDVVQEHLLIRNLSPRTVSFHLSAADGYFTSGGRFNMLASDIESTGAGTWIAIQDTVEVAAGADVIVPFSIAVPHDATPGDHPAGVAASVRSGESDEVGIESRVGFRVMTRVTGELTPSAKAEIAGGYVGAWNPFEPGRLDLEYTVTNAGNTRLTFSPQVSATTLFGLLSATAAGAEIVEMAPGESRTFKTALAELWPWFAYTVEIDAGGAAIDSDGGAAGSVTAQATSLIPAIPWAQLIASALSVLLIWALWRDHNRRQRRIDARIERAREEGRAAADGGGGEPAMPGAVARIVVAVIVAAVLALPAAPARASAQPEQEGTVSITVDIEVDPNPILTPTTTPTLPVPSGSLPVTGGSDVSALAFAGIFAGLAGALMVTHRALKRRARIGGKPG